MSGPIHQEVVIKADPKKVYQTLTTASGFAAFSGSPAEISPEVGGAFTCHDGFVTGRNVDLVPNTRIVQAWRGCDWAEGSYSIIKIELKAEGSGTRLVFEHTGFPEEKREHLTKGWTEHYWAPLSKYLS